MNENVSIDFDVVVRAGQVFDGTSATQSATWLGISEGKIRAISDKPLSGKTNIGGPSCTALPGLIDSHIHFFDFNNAKNESQMHYFETEEAPGRLNSFIDHGVTSIKSLGDPEDRCIKLKRSLEDMNTVGPRLFVVGPSFTAPGGHPAATIYRNNRWYAQQATVEVDSVDSAREKVNQLAKSGVDSIKVNYQGGCQCHLPKAYIWKSRTLNVSAPILRLRRSVLRAIIDEAHKLNLKVTAHTVELDPAIAALEDGVDGLEHGVVDEAIGQSNLIDLLLHNDASYVPTLFIHGNPDANKNLREIHDAGVRVVLGTDSFIGHGNFGANTIDECELMFGCGLTPLDVLRTATFNASVHLGRGDLGRIELGASADLLIADGDPITNLRDLKRVTSVLQEGRILRNNTPQ